VNVRIIAPNASMVAAELPITGQRIRVRVGRSVAHHAMLLKTRVQANASGRPGPNAPTGDYRRSWALEVRQAAGGVVAAVGTNKPQGRRLEFGFVGADSLGRVYNQPAFPHVGPAVDDVEPKFQADIAAIIDTEAK
jgi:hypothetical protein